MPYFRNPVVSAERTEGAKYIPQGDTTYVSLSVSPCITCCKNYQAYGKQIYFRVCILGAEIYQLYHFRVTPFPVLTNVLIFKKGYITYIFCPPFQGHVMWQLS